MSIEENPVLAMILLLLIMKFVFVTLHLYIERHCVEIRRRNIANVLMGKSRTRIHQMERSRS